ncbi:MAG: hypothetical protein V7K27_03265 [Nostoc sp.]|uniref:hypothetical protein n=1 Tax=Nostoc sp. TaxID=1180 RepID=UPI002FF9DD8A
MKQYIGVVKNFLLLATSAIASSMLATLPSQAATFSSAQTEVAFTRFNQSPSQTTTDVNTTAIVIAQNGILQALANAEGLFIVDPTEVSSSSLSEALGAGSNYLGLAESQAQVIGSFVVNPGTPFYFDFTATLNLLTAIDNPPAESAKATGAISFALVDTASQSILDIFSLIGNLSTPGNNDFLAIQYGGNLTFSNPVTNYNFGGQQEYATAYVQGSLQRSFANTTTVSLIELMSTGATVTAPEPSTNLGLLLSCGVIGFVFRGRASKLS